jgi:hypothetical protein
MGFEGRGGNRGGRGGGRGGFGKNKATFINFIFFGSN